MLGAATLLALSLLAAPLVGSSPIDFGEVLRAPFDWDGNPDAAILFIARIPRVLLAVLVGGSLALTGAVYQSLLRNPLASPYTLGVSAGATLGSFLALRFAPAGRGAELLVPGAALGGALLATAAVMALAGPRRRTPSTVLLLAGVTLNFTFGAVILLLQYFADFTETARMVRWMMGDLEGATYRVLMLMAIALLPGWWVLARTGRSLNLMSLGEEEALAQGVDAAAVARGSLLWAAWITGFAVAVAGPVGFIGIIVPHAIRMIAGHDFRIVLPVACIGGGAFLVLCDTAARTLLAPIELPIGVLTACLGGPFFLALLLRRRAVPTVAIVVALSATLQGCGPGRAEPVEVGVGPGDASAPARRVVSLVPAATETLFAMGAGDLVVGVSSYDEWPPEARELPRVGALLDPDLERILSLHADLVVIDSGSATFAASLEAAGIRHVPVVTGTIAEGLEAMRRLGELVGHEDEGAALADRVGRELEAVRASAATSRRTLLVFGRRSGGLGNVFVSGGVGFLHELVEIAGGENVFGDVAHPSFKAGLEAILAASPELIVEVRPQMADDDPAIDGIVAEWKRLPGFADVGVVVATGSALLLPGPRLPDAARRLADAIAAH
jgi:iron complex transport system permease protein